jgi:histidine triad (HIT) family protein
MSCLFCQIVAKTHPADIVYEDADLIVFKDINPRGTTHVLLTPKEHIATINDMQDHHTLLLGKLFATAKKLAEAWSIVEPGYRLTVNVGRGGGQIIDHVHMHMVSGWQRQRERA